jgi:hypothetical protein
MASSSAQSLVPGSPSAEEDFDIGNLDGATYEELQAEAEREKAAEMIAYIRHVNAKNIVEYAGSECGWSDLERVEAVKVLEQPGSVGLDEYDLKGHPFWRRLEDYARAWSQEIQGAPNLFQWLKHATLDHQGIMQWPSVAGVHALVALSLFHTGVVDDQLRLILRIVMLEALIRGE